LYLPAPRLQLEEDATEGKAQQLYGALVQEVLGYQGYPEGEALAMLEAQCGAAVSERRAAAGQLQQQVGGGHSLHVSAALTGSAACSPGK
jgi:hypothetical protein